MDLRRYTTQFLTTSPLSIIEMQRLYKIRETYYHEIAKAVFNFPPCIIDTAMQRRTYKAMNYTCNKHEKTIAHLLYLEDIFSKTDIDIDDEWIIIEIRC